MQNALISYQFEEEPVRVVMVADDPWFAANDVAKVLGYRDAFNMARNLDDDEKGTHILSTLGGTQEMSIVSESGLYAAIFKSRRPEARRFRKWVTAVVLPELRRTGRYQIADYEPPEYDANRLNACVATVREARRLFGLKGARRIWAQIGLPMPIANASADIAGDELSGLLKQYLTANQAGATVSEIVQGIGLDDADRGLRRRVASLLRLFGWWEKRARRGRELVYAWYPPEALAGEG